jgi:hypothetical protein
LTAPVNAARRGERISAVPNIPGELYVENLFDIPARLSIQER